MSFYKVTFFQYEDTILTETAGKAKYQHWRNGLDEEISFKEFLKYVKCRKVGKYKELD